MAMPGAALRLVCLAALVALAATHRAHARSEPLLIDLSTHLIEIDSSFTGTSILLFGATDAPGEVVVAVRGPTEPMVVRRMRRSAGIWVNRDSVAFRDVPQYYAVAASRPLFDVLDESLLRRYELGVDHVSLNTVWSHTSEKISDFREALRRERQRERLYTREVGHVVFIDESLFRAELFFPAEVSTGAYVADAYLVQDRRVVASKSVVLNVEKSGLSADLTDFAQRNEAVYGLIAIVAALVAGWVGSLAFRKA